MGSWGVGLFQNDAGLDVRRIHRYCRKMGFRGGDLAAIVLAADFVQCPRKSNG
jgi:hypothetical protein